jgi:hydroxymethylbilane synthase
MADTIKIGTRGSRLALWQAEWVKSRLEASCPERVVELVIIKTKGDKILDVPLAKVGGKGLFVKEIEDCLLDGRVDLAVHSMKDMPAEIPAGLCIGPIPEREDPRDVLISRGEKLFAGLTAGARIGTSSLRRAAQLKHWRQDITIVPLRGNLDTRLKKLHSETENLDAIILAAAGVKRLGLEDRISEYLEADIMLPAVAQGALCIEMRDNDAQIASAVECLDHPDTRTVVMGERAFLNRLGGSCQVPIAGFGVISNDVFSLSGLVAGLEGSPVIRNSISGSLSTAVESGIALAEDLISRGADKILDTLTE